MSSKQNLTFELIIIAANDVRYVEFWGKINVYAVVSLNGDETETKQTSTTPIAFNGDDSPRWNHAVKFSVNEAKVLKGQFTLAVELFCHKVEEDMDIGEVNVPVLELLLNNPPLPFCNDNGMELVTYPVKATRGFRGIKGTLNFSYRFKPDLGDPVTLVHDIFPTQPTCPNPENSNLPTRCLLWSETTIIPDRQSMYPPTQSGQPVCLRPDHLTQQGNHDVSIQNQSSLKHEFSIKNQSSVNHEFSTQNQSSTSISTGQPTNYSTPNLGNLNQSAVCYNPQFQATIENLILELEIHFAKDIKNVNTLTKMDAYAVVSITGDKPGNQQRIKTPVAYSGGTNPAWNHVIEVPVNGKLASKGYLTLTIELISKRTLGDHEIGEVNVPILDLIGSNPPLLSPNGTKMFASYNVKVPKGTKGTLSFSFRFRTSPVLFGSQYQPLSFGPVRVNTGLASSYGLPILHPSYSYH